MTDIARHFLTVDRRQVHYLRAGAGSAVVFLHSTPASSRELIPLLRLVSDRFTVLALDMPGYGLSDPLPVESPTVADYAEATASAIDVLVARRCSLYGLGTGAAVALELARRRPERFAAVVLEGLLVLTDDERSELLERHSPEFEPRWDGAHLIAMWNYCRDQHLFRPWFRRERETRIDRDLPGALTLHEEVVDLLRAGVRYGDGQAAAFRFDVRAAAAELAIPVSLAHRGDQLGVDLETLRPLPAGSRIEHLPVDQRATTEVVAGLLASAASTLDPPPLAPMASAVPGAVWKRYVATGAGRLLVRQVGALGGKPLVMLHASPGSAAALEPLMLELGTSRPVLAFDTLGNGDSDKPISPDVEIRDLAATVVEALETLEVGECDLFGSHTGALIALEVAISQGDRVGRVILEGVTLFGDDARPDLLDRRELLAEYLPSFEPRWDGTHLLWAWNFRRDFALYWPWFRRTRAGIRWVPPTEPRVLHRAIVEFFKSGETYRVPYAAALAYPTQERLPLLHAAALVATIADDPLGEYTPEACRLAPSATPAVIPEAIGEVARIYERFLSDDSERGAPSRAFDEA